MGTEQPAQVSLPTEIVGSVKFLVGIAHPFRTHTFNRNESTIQPTIIHSNQSTIPGHSDRYYSPLGILDIGTGVPRSGRNIDNRTGVNPQGHIGTTISEFNSTSNWKKFDSVSMISDIAYRSLSWNGAEKSEIENLGGNHIFENAERKNIFEVEKVGRKNSFIFNHKDSN